jgi:tetratricopeptide (TPR) repeat protein
MPAVVADSFRLADHWIRVHPDGGFKAQPVDPSLRSRVVPKREFLRLIAVDDREKMQMVTQRLSKGESFSSVAHELSIDASAPGGGYIGDMRLSEMDAKLAAAAAQLPYGGTSSVIEIGNNFMFLQREPRDFRWQANQLFKEASDLKDRGYLTAAVAKNQQALQVYPYLLRGLVMMATMLGQAGKVDRAAEILRFASQSYPDDASTQFDLALTLGKHPAEQIDALRRAIDLDPDMVAAYQSLGAALYATGQPQAAIEAFRRGLQIDPLSAVLYYDLGLALKAQGDSAESQKALRLAARLDPEISARNANPL